MEHDHLDWHKSSFSGDKRCCVEVAITPTNHRLVRHSQHPTGPVLTFTADEWRAFIAGARADEI